MAHPQWLAAIVAIPVLLRPRRALAWALKLWWGWRALRCGNRYAARRHAIDALKMHPLKPAAWKLAVCAARGH